MPDTLSGFFWAAYGVGEKTHTHARYAIRLFLGCLWGRRKDAYYHTTSAGTFIQSERGNRTKSYRFNLGMPYDINLVGNSWSESNAAQNKGKSLDNDLGGLTLSVSVMVPAGASQSAGNI